VKVKQKGKSSEGETKRQKLPYKKQLSVGLKKFLKKTLQ